MLEVDGLGTRAGDDEAEVFVAFEQQGQGADEEVGAFVVEEAADYYDGYGVARAEGLAGVRGWGEEGASGGLEVRGFGFVGLKWAEVAGYYCVGDYGDG